MTEANRPGPKKKLESSPGRAYSWATSNVYRSGPDPDVPLGSPCMHCSKLSSMDDLRNGGSSETSVSPTSIAWPS